MARSILLGISDEEAAADVLDVEGGEANGNSVIVEGVLIEMYAAEIRVVDLNLAIAEIGDIKETLAIDFARSHSFVDRTIGRALVGVIDFEDGVDRGRFSTSGNIGTGVPSRNRSILGGEHEESGQIRRRTLVQNKIGGAAVEDYAGGRGLGAGREARRGNHDEIIERAVDAVTVGIGMRIRWEVVYGGCGGGGCRDGVERRGARGIGGDPPRAAVRST